LLIALAFTQPTPLRAQRTQPGDFDYYILALSVAPSFCDLTGRRAHKAQCDSPSDDDFRKTPLTLHGLWPNKKDTPTRQQPRACSRTKLPSLSDDLTAQLQTYMPGIADDLPVHEWDAHGTCAGLPAEKYFGAMVSLARAANASIGAAMRDNDFFGKQVDIRRLLAAIGKTDPALAQSIVVVCESPRQRGEGPGAYIGEIRVLLSPELRDANGDAWPADFVNRSAVGLQAMQGCRNGKGFLPGGFDD
jgi:ribonuclease T2